jgi:lipopolysaccharide/colanic/teichoic acid biosynthesis glycosyltransferase
VTDMLLGQVTTTERSIFHVPTFDLGAHPLAGRGLVVKRLLDIVLASVALILVTPVVLLVLIAVKLESPGPVFFKQERVGRGHRLFWLYKIRSMRADAESCGHQALTGILPEDADDPHNFKYKLAGDSRVTKVGRFIRKRSIDELPQLWNVLKGDMSLVGPRPALPHEVALYDDLAHQRLAVEPGITGLWQISGRCNVTFHEMIEMDIAYAQEWTPLRDLAILARTPIVALTGKGAA